MNNFHLYYMFPLCPRCIYLNSASNANSPRPSKENEHRFEGIDSHLCLSPSYRSGFEGIAMAIKLMAHSLYALPYLRDDNTMLKKPMLNEPVVHYTEDNYHPAGFLEFLLSE